MIHFNSQVIISDEMKCIEEALNKGIGGMGAYTKKSENFLKSYFSIKEVLLTPSCSHALEMIALLVDTKPGDEFIMPSFTYVTTASEFVKFGGVPVFVDIREDTLNIDENLIERAITDKTKAIVVVHYAGVGAEMDRILEIAKKHNLIVIEDAAQGVNAKYNGRYLGSFGALGCYSFHETKNYSMGEGGALLINDEKYIDRAYILRDRGTDRTKFLRGQVSSYKWVDIGAGYYASDLNAAVLWARLEKKDYVQEKRKKIWKTYYEELKVLEEKGYAKLPTIPSNADPNWHIFYMLLKSRKIRDQFINWMMSRGIQVTFHYIPLHTSPYYIEHFKKVSLPVTEKVADTIVRLPLHLALTEEDIVYIIKNTLSFFMEGGAGNDRIA